MTGASKSPAVISAEKAQAKLEQCMDANSNFRLEAGAGAGKTYSLVAALQRLIEEKGTELQKAGQKVACITYTEVARKEIAQEIEEHPAILVATIHSFAWSFISRFQKQLRELVGQHAGHQDAIVKAGGIHDQVVEYNQGFFKIDDKRITLHHDDVPRMLGALLANEKFQRNFTARFPVVFIDEYQDTDPAVMSALSENFFQTKTGPLIGLFGDHWQTIHRKDYELAAFPNVEGIDKGANFRSVSAIVDVLNRLRPELKQSLHDEDSKGEARFFHCNEFAGIREDSQHAKRELPSAAITQFVESLKAKLTKDGWDLQPKKTKILMLTHAAIAAERGYPGIVEIFSEYKDAFVKKEDLAIAFLADTVEPVCSAYARRNYGEMFQLLGAIPTIRKAADKAEWRTQMDKLLELRKSGTIGEVIDYLKETRRPRLTDRLMKREAEIAELGPVETEAEANSLKRHRQLRTVPYAEIIALVDFINGFTLFATQHSVKGAEFENVLVMLSGGWNHYNWPKYLEQRQAGSIPAKDQKGYYRARNLFYVALSRPKTRLAVLATQELNAKALASVMELFGEHNVIALPKPGGLSR